MAENNSTAVDTLQEQQNREEMLASTWIANLLTVLDDSLAQAEKAAIVRACGVAHYRSANMDELVSQYKGDIEAFLQFLSEKWGWKIAYDQSARTITADENKSVCVCPLVQGNVRKVSPTLCHCSEGFAERTFSAVIGKPVEAQVTRAILRGDKSCVYTIQVL